MVIDAMRAGRRSFPVRDLSRELRGVAADVGRSRRPRVVDDEIVPRLVLDLTISVDHAVVDGAPAARFATTLVQMIEHPEWIDGS